MKKAADSCDLYLNFWLCDCSSITNEQMRESEKKVAAEMERAMENDGKPAGKVH